MESATILTSPSTCLSGISEGSEFEKISTLYQCTGRTFTNSMWHNDSCCEGNSQRVFHLFVILMPSHSHRVTFGHIEFHLPIGFPLS